MTNKKELNKEIEDWIVSWEVSRTEYWELRDKYDQLVNQLETILRGVKQ